MEQAQSVIDQALQGRFGLHFLFPFQRLVVSNILGDEPSHYHQIVILPTGAGKSLCFQLPSLLLEGLTVVVYPLLSLMSDQARRLEEKGIPVVVLKGGMFREERRSALTSLSDGSARFVITNPETLHQQWCLDALKPLTVSHAVLDEAHCVSQWGESFRPAYLTVGDSFRAIQVERITAFTATAGPKILDGIRKYIFPDGAHLIQGNTDRENIYYRVVPAAVKTRTIAQEIRANPRPAIVFCATRRSTERVAVNLIERLHPIPVRFYHAGLSRPRKKEIEEWFFTSDDGVLVSTTAYGMGVDKPNIRHVLHHDIPDTPEAYLQESGRAGRDRLPSLSTIVYDATDEYSRNLSGGMGKIIRSTECRRNFLAGMMGFEQDTCTGCDYCDNRVRRDNTLMQTLLRFIRRYSHVFTGSEIASRLGRTAQDREDILISLETLAQTGLVKVNHRNHRISIRHRSPRYRGVFRRSVRSLASVMNS